MEWMRGDVEIESEVSKRRKRVSEEQGILNTMSLGGAWQDASKVRIPI